MVSGVTIGLLSLTFDHRRDLVFTLAAMTIVDLAIEGSRMYSASFRNWTNRVFKTLMKEGEEKRFTGIPYFLIGCTLAALVFPREIAVLAILYLAFGDPVASLFGTRFGRRAFPSRLHIPAKSLEGTMACFLVCFFITFGMSMVMAKTFELDLLHRLAFSILGGLGATFGEFLPLRTDDNLSLPLISGGFLWLTASFLNLIPGLYI